MNLSHATIGRHEALACSRVNRIALAAVKGPTRTSRTARHRGRLSIAARNADERAITTGTAAGD